MPTAATKGITPRKQTGALVQRERLQVLERGPVLGDPADVVGQDEAGQARHAGVPVLKGA
jgi:hypothetical protein